MIKVQYYLTGGMSVLGLAVMWSGLLPLLLGKSHRQWLQDCGALIILMGLWVMTQIMHAEIRESAPTMLRLRRLCDSYGVPYSLNSCNRWICPLMFTTVSLAITIRAAAMILRTEHQSLRYACMVLEAVCVFGSVIFATRSRSVGNVLDKLESVIHSGKLPDSPPAGAKFILLLIPKRNREHLIGDLEEEYRTILVPEYGVRKARTWYWWQVAISIGPLLWAHVKRGAAIAWLWKRVR